MSPRRPPKPSPVGDDPCVLCGNPGSTCGDCGVVLCALCNVNPHVPAGHQPSAHRTPPPVVPETELQRLLRENAELELQLHGTQADRLRRHNQALRAELARRAEEPPT